MDDDDITIVNVLLSPPKKQRRNNDAIGSNHSTASGSPASPSTATATSTQIQSQKSAPTNAASPNNRPLVQPSKTPITAAFASLLDACREADPSADMEQLITRKLTRYYHTVHPDFVCSKSFSKAALLVAADVRAHPQLVYMKLAGILEELNIRRRSGQMAAAAAAAETDGSKTAPAVVMGASGASKAEQTKADADAKTTTTSAAETATADAAATTAATSDGDAVAESAAESASTGNAKKDRQIKKLNHALYELKKQIARLDAADFDLDDEENSPYLQAERYKKRACEIYEKICDITGESKHACRSTRKPIVFQGTPYPLFNRTIQSFVNKTRQFPNLFEVRRCLEHCNAQYGFDLSRDEVSRVAQDAFAQIGELLQRRRKMDLYESIGGVASIGCSSVIGPEATVDPALNDVQLQRKLAENEAESKRRMNALIDRYVWSRPGRG